MFKDKAIMQPRENIINGNQGSPENHLINPQGPTIKERVMVPKRFKRIEASNGSFTGYLRNLPLKPMETKVKYHDGEEKPNDVAVALIDMNVGTRDLQRCADAVIRHRAEYFYKNKQYDKIHFNFTNGFRADFKK